MDLQNIVLNFAETTVTSLYEGVDYSISIVSNMTALQTELNAEAGFTVANAVIQYTDEQHGDVPRIVVSDGNADPELEVRDILPLSGLSANLTTEIATARGEVESEIN
jgi:hypothetical protein